MPKSDQGVTRDRYLVIPRTLIFVTNESSVLLIKGAPTKRLWSNLYNGIGGHIERGEDALSAAYRELQEETGLAVKQLYQVGTLIVDASDDVGICLFIFRGEYTGGDLVVSEEGQLEWVQLDHLDDYPLVEDLKIILPGALVISDHNQPFSARSYYDANEKIKIEFGG